MRASYDADRAIADPLLAIQPGWSSPARTQIGHIRRDAETIQEVLRILGPPVDPGELGRGDFDGPPLLPARAATTGDGNDPRVGALMNDKQGHNSQFRTSFCAQLRRFRNP